MRPSAVLRSVFHDGNFGEHRHDHQCSQSERKGVWNECPNRVQFFRDCAGRSDDRSLWNASSLRWCGIGVSRTYRFLHLQLFRVLSGVCIKLNHKFHSFLQRNCESAKIGTGSQRGIYQNSHLNLNSGANMTVTGSTVQSEALGNDSITRASSPFNFIHNMTVSQTVLQTGPNPANVTFSSGYRLLINRTNVITNPNSTLSINAYQFTSYDSRTPANTYRGQFDRLRISPQYYNSQCQGSENGNLSKLCMVICARPHKFFSPSAGSNSHTAQSGPGGRSPTQVKPIPAVGQKLAYYKLEANATTSVNKTAYVVQASQGAAFSNQQYVSPNNTSVPQHDFEFRERDFWAEFLFVCAPVQYWSALDVHESVYQRISSQLFETLPTANWILQLWERGSTTTLSPSFIHQTLPRLP